MRILLTAPARATRVKFTSEGGTGRGARLARDGAGCGARSGPLFAIGDTGIGIDGRRHGAPLRTLRAARRRARPQVRRYRARSALGEGLIELQGGTLVAKSEFGKGSTFSVLRSPIGGVGAPRFVPAMRQREETA
jgi:hypothetical protein